jgi:hypothetical protein
VCQRARPGRVMAPTVSTVSWRIRQDLPSRSMRVGLGWRFAGPGGGAAVVGAVQLFVAVNALEGAQQGLQGVQGGWRRFAR